MNVARQCTTDYLGNLEFTSLADGTGIFEYRVEPDTFPTLSRFAASYQRIRYHKITFQLSCHLPTSASGGYVMGFRPDPMDKLPSAAEERKRFVVGTPGSIKNSIWQSTDMTIPSRVLTNRLFYTSLGTDAREFSPGTLFVVVDGTVNQAGSISVSATYDVSCSIPSLEYNVRDEEAAYQNVRTVDNMYLLSSGRYFLQANRPDGPYFRWDDFLPNTIRPETYIVFKCDEFVIVHPDDATEDEVENTRFVLYAPNDYPSQTGVGCFYPVVPESDPSKGLWQRGNAAPPQVGSTQRISAYTDFVLLEEYSFDPTLPVPTAGN